MFNPLRQHQNEKPKMSILHFPGCTPDDCAKCWEGDVVGSVERMSNMVLRGAENLRTAPGDRKSADRYEHVVVSEEARRGHCCQRLKE